MDGQNFMYADILFRIFFISGGVMAREERTGQVREIIEVHRYLDWWLCRGLVAVVLWIENQAKSLPLPVLVSKPLFSLSTLLENISNKPHLLKYTVQWGLTVISSYETTSQMQNISITSAKGVSCLYEIHFSLTYDWANTTLTFIIVD